MLNNTEIIYCVEIHSKYRSMELIFTYQCLMLIFKFTDCKDFVLFYILVLGGKMFKKKNIMSQFLW